MTTKHVSSNQATVRGIEPPDDNSLVKDEQEKW